MRQKIALIAGLLPLVLLLALTPIHLNQQSCEAFIPSRVRRASPFKASRNTVSPFLVSSSRTYRSDGVSLNEKNSDTNSNWPPTTSLVGDDAAYFSFQDQNIADWMKFSAATAFVLLSISYVWFLPGGLHWGDLFLESVQQTTTTTNNDSTLDPASTIFRMLTIFAVTHSGMASMRPFMESIIGARAWRVIFATVSLPLALSCISYFINHAHEGVQLWDFTNSPPLHAACFLTNFISFLFLYPSTFNLLEIAAIEKPQLHLWETGIIRITRHPQAIGQILWCTAHTLWLGTSVALAASTVLVAHHVFSMWNGDRRLKERHGDAFDLIQSKTSIVPFAAILDGRQQLPNEYYKEFLRLPYALVVGGTLLAYAAHPYMMAGAALLHW